MYRIIYKALAVCAAYNFRSWGQETMLSDQYQGLPPTLKQRLNYCSVCKSNMLLGKDTQHPIPTDIFYRVAR